MCRTSLNQPEHRRPSWAKTHASYHANICQFTTRSSGQSHDYGLDNFSYDQAHIPEFEIPNGLLPLLPEELHSAAVKWVLAGAALHTALDRVQTPEVNAATTPAKSTPDQTSFAIPSNDSPSPTELGSTTPATTPSASFTGSMVALVAKYNKLLVVNPYTQLPTNMLGMESPPFTPVDTHGANTPADPVTEDRTDTTPDPSRLHAQLVPLSSSQAQAQQTGASETPAPSAASAASATQIWESWARTYNAEIHDLKHRSFTRFAGLDRCVHKLLVELEGDTNLGEERRVAIDAFQEWFEGVSGKVSAYQLQVSSLHEKLLS